MYLKPPATRFLPRFRCWGILVTALVLGACGRKDEVHTLEFLAMGTTVAISVAGPDVAGQEAILGDVETRMQRLGQEWYPWTVDGSGELARLNAAIARGETATVSAELGALLETAQTLAALSGGRFDPAVGRLVELWGFKTGTRDPALPLPDRAALDDWASHRPTYADLKVAGNLVQSRNPALKLDLGAIAKGRVVDLAVSRLQSAGITRALVRAGGNVHAIGGAPGRPWRVAIRDPRSNGTLGWIELRDGESIDTSGDYEHFALVNGRRIHHLLDPRTGSPPDHTAAVTVIAANGTLADAAATALFIAGPDDWQPVAQSLGITTALRIDTEGHLEVTRELAGRMHWTRENQNIVIVGP